MGTKRSFKEPAAGRAGEAQHEMSLTASPCFVHFWTVINVGCCVLWVTVPWIWGWEGRTVLSPLYFAHTLCFWTKENQIIGNSLLFTLIHGTYLISLLESEECCPNVIYCPHFSLNLYLKLLMRDLTKLRHWGCLTINYKFPLLGVSVCWQLMKLPVLQDTT